MWSTRTRSHNLHRLPYFSNRDVFLCIRTTKQRAYTLILGFNRMAMSRCKPSTFRIRKRTKNVPWDILRDSYHHINHTSTYTLIYYVWNIIIINYICFQSTQVLAIIYFYVRSEELIFIRSANCSGSCYAYLGFIKQTHETARQSHRQLRHLIIILTSLSKLLTTLNINMRS